VTGTRHLLVVARRHWPALVAAIVVGILGGAAIDVAQGAGAGDGER
jgi:hypothetical protein